jgi:L-ribulose-5-phosphate 4-epimerase
MKEGYVKFGCIWEERPVTLPIDQLDGLDLWRRKLYELHLIGAYDDGIGFGNISVRRGVSNAFFITGSATGSLPLLASEHYALVERFDIAGNTLECTGTTKASSESLSHAAVYVVSPVTGAVIHVHSNDLWQRGMYVHPTTDPKAEYGTPEMALEVSRIVEEQGSESGGIIVMGGHQDGIISYGSDLTEAGHRIVALIQGE